MSVRAGTIALSALMIGAAGLAQAREGWYGRVDAGYSVDGEMDSDPNFSAFGNAGPFDDGWTVGAGLGRASENGWRLEGEVARRANDLEAPRCPPQAACALIAQSFDAEARVWSAMLNALYDFNRAGALQPFVGAGVGLASINAEIHAGPPATIEIDDEDSAFAWQALAGVGLALGDRVRLELAYRHFDAGEAEFSGSTSLNRPYVGDYSHDAMTLGARWAFR